MVKLSIIIVTWNAGQVLERCLKAIPAGTSGLSYETLLVDNASTDGSVEHARRRYPEIHILSPGENLGFGRGVELATRQARGEFIAVVNPDLVLEPRALANLVEFLEDHPEAGLVGPRVCSSNGEIETGAERFPGLLSAFAEIPLVARFYRRARQRWRHAENAVSCDWVRGALIVLRREALREAGSFPTATFMYGEEMLLGHSLRESGWSVYYLPSTLAIHYTGFSTRRRWTLKERIIVQRIARIRVMQSFLSTPAFVLWNLLVTMGLVLQSVARRCSGSTPHRTHPPYGRLLRLHMQALFNPKSPLVLPEGRTV